MPSIIINGKWKGKVTYNDTYPKEYRNEVLSFELNLSSEDGFITGTCEDDITKELLLKAATIEGTYGFDTIHFIKRYPCEIILDEANKLATNPLEPSAGIQYEGKLCQRWFSGKQYFKGEWDISGSFIDEYGNAQYYTCGGNWKMEKII